MGFPLHLVFFFSPELACHLIDCSLLTLFSCLAANTCSGDQFVS